MNFKDRGGGNRDKDPQQQQRREGEEGEADRVVVIRGTYESASHAEVMIRKIIADQPVIEVREITVPKGALGRIIGRSYWK